MTSYGLDPESRSLPTPPTGAMEGSTPSDTVNTTESLESILFGIERQTYWPLPIIGIFPDWVNGHRRSKIPGPQSWFAPDLVGVDNGVGISWPDQTRLVLSCLSLALLTLAALTWVTVWYFKKASREHARYLCLLTAVLCTTLTQAVTFTLCSHVTLTQAGFIALVAVLETADQAFVFILYFYVVFCVLALARRSVGSGFLVTALCVSGLVAALLVFLRLGITKSVSQDRDFDFYTKNLFLITSIPKLITSFVAFCMLSFTLYWSLVLDDRSSTSETANTRVVLYSAICVFVVIVYSVINEIAWLLVFFHRYDDAPTDTSTARLLSASRGVVVFFFLCILDLEVLAFLTCKADRDEEKKRLLKDVDDIFPLNGEHTRGLKPAFLTDVSEDSFYETASCGGSESTRFFDRHVERSRSHGDSLPGSPLSGVSTEFYGSIPEFCSEEDKREARP